MDLQLMRKKNNCLVFYEVQVWIIIDGFVSGESSILSFSHVFIHLHVFIRCKVESAQTSGTIFQTNRIAECNCKVYILILL